MYQLMMGVSLLIPPHRVLLYSLTYVYPEFGPQDMKVIPLLIEGNYLLLLRTLLSTPGKHDPTSVNMILPAVFFLIRNTLFLLIIKFIRLLYCILRTTEFMFYMRLSYYSNVTTWDNLKEIQAHQNE